MMKTTGNTENNKRGLLPYPVIIAETKGDSQAMSIVVQQYESYISSLSMRKLRDERGNTYYGIEVLRVKRALSWSTQAINHAGIAFALHDAGFYVSVVNPMLVLTTGTTV